MNRIAVVRHGDYREASGILASGAVEPYAGMRHSVTAIETLLRGHEYLIISLDAPCYREARTLGTLVGMPPIPRLAPMPGEGLLNMRRWAHRVRCEVDGFAPTHLLLRTSGFMAYSLLRLSIRRQWNSLVLLANSFDETSWRSRRLNRRLIALTNDPTVWRVGNHRTEATQMMVEFGSRSRKGSRPTIGRQLVVRRIFRPKCCARGSGAFGLCRDDGHCQGHRGFD